MMLVVVKILLVVMMLLLLFVVLVTVVEWCFAVDDDADNASDAQPTSPKRGQKQDWHFHHDHDYTFYQGDDFLMMILFLI